VEGKTEVCYRVPLNSEALEDRIMTKDKVLFGIFMIILMGILAGCGTYDYEKKVNTQKILHQEIMIGDIVE